MSNSSQSFTLVFAHYRRWDDDEWEVIEPQHLDFWINEAPLLSKRTFEHDGCLITIEVNWEPIAKRYRRDFDLMKAVREAQTKNDDWFSKVRQKVHITAIASMKNKNGLSNYQWYPTFFLELYLYEFFLMANLALPGVVHFYNMTIEGTNESSTTKLSSYEFDYWMVESIRGRWPTFQRIPFKKVIHWYLYLQIGVKQKADTGTERAIFAVHHLAKMDPAISSLIWLFHGLEALFSTRIGENQAGLARRISTFFELDEKKKSYLKKRIKELYDLRSSFVHGTYGVWHPIQSEPIDKRLDADYDRINSATMFGFALLIATLQRMIDEDILELSYEEKFIGRKIPKI